MTKKLLLSAIAASLLMVSGASNASWFGNNGNNWGPFGGNGWGNDWNPYDEWDPRYWIREMDNNMDDDNYGPGYGYGGPGYGYGGPGYGYGGPGYGYGGPGYGYGGPGYGYGAPGYGGGPYGPAPYAAPQAAPAPARR